MMVRQALLVALGGAAGSMLRYLVGCALVSTSFALPVATLAVNAIGSLLIGIMMASITAGQWYLIGVVGFCGGFTTFSTFSAEMLTMFRQGNVASALLYAALSLTICLAAVAVGYYLTVRFRG